MAADGVREVTLLGQNVNSYGRDLPIRRPSSAGCAGAMSEEVGRGRITFAELLGLLDGVEGIERIRYTSPHPKDMREDVIRAHVELASVCEHIHLPLQSGSSRILKAMRRTYDRRRYLDRVALIREHLPDVSLTTDIIVGFPGETEEDFRADDGGRRGGRLRRRLHVHLLAAPRHRGGGAERWPGAPSGQGASGWSGWSSSSSAARSRAPSASSGARSRCWSRVPRARIPTRLRGRTRHNKVVNFAGLAGPGELADVLITDATSQTLSGEERLLARTTP